MLCDGCHENEAVVFYTEIINGAKKELHLCEASAAQEEYEEAARIRDIIRAGRKEADEHA